MQVCISSTQLELCLYRYRGLAHSFPGNGAADALPTTAKNFDRCSLTQRPCSLRFQPKHFANFHICLQPLRAGVPAPSVGQPRDPLQRFLLGEASSSLLVMCWHACKTLHSESIAETLAKRAGGPCRGVLDPGIVVPTSHVARARLRAGRRRGRAARSVDHLLSGALPACSTQSRA